MTLGGYANRIAHIDLTSHKVTYQPIPEEWALKYIGGRGLGVRFVFENGPQVEPLSPENILCFMNGPLTGSEANLSGRMAIVTKSPLTGTITDSHHEGWSAARLRWAGFDGLIFKGRSKNPVYIYVHNGYAEIRDASDLWGKGIHETIRELKERHGENDLSVIAIGPASEKLVRFGCWIDENNRSSSRGSTGCIGGSKNLKAVVIKAEKRVVKAVDNEAWRPVQQRVLAMIMDPKNVTSPQKGGLSVYGTNVFMNMTNNVGALPTKNAMLTSFGPGAERISGEFVKKHILVSDPTCHACPVACKKEVEVNEGPFRGLRMESLEYESAWAVGANCGNDDIATVAKIIDLCTDYGMDVIDVGGILAMVMEATERGYAKEDERLTWGDTHAMVSMVHAIGQRKGIGNILANGLDPAARYFSHPEIAMSVKGQGIPAYDPRGLKGMGLGFATSNRGASHLSGFSPASELGLIPLKTDPLAWKGKGELLKLLQDLHAFSDSLDLCMFSTFAEGADEYAAQYSAFVGVNLTGEGALRIGERIYNLERHYNNLAGFGPGSDMLPQRFLTEPSTMPGSLGQVCELGLMLDEYYRARGWINGVVPVEKMRELGIIELKPEPV